MRYSRLPTSIDEQITLLTSRGMRGDEALMRRWLETVGYYRLSAYWLPWEIPAARGVTRSKLFRSNTRFEDIVEIYVFDRKLRLLVMEAIDRFEIAARARWTNRFSLAYGAHAHMDAKNFTDGFQHSQMYSKLNATSAASQEVFVKHYRSKYTDPHLPPIWQVTELMSMGEISKWVQATRDNKIKNPLL